MKETFSLAEVLTITTGRLLSDMDGVYRILNFLTQDDIFTHVIPRAMRTVEPYLKSLFPEFETGDFQYELGLLITGLESDVAKDHKRAFIDGWLQKQIAVYGDEFILEPMPAEKWLQINPVTELKEDLSLSGNDAKIIEVQI